jgi:hypothetical protein
MSKSFFSAFVRTYAESLASRLLVSNHENKVSIMFGAKVETITLADGASREACLRDVAHAVERLFGFQT